MNFWRTGETLLEKARDANVTESAKIKIPFVNFMMILYRKIIIFSNYGDFHIMHIPKEKVFYYNSAHYE